MYFFVLYLGKTDVMDYQQTLITIVVMAVLFFTNIKKTDRIIKPINLKCFNLVSPSIPVTDLQTT